MTPTDYPDRVRALLEAARPGPWIAGTEQFRPAVFATSGSAVDVPIADDIEDHATAALIAEAPTLARAYLAACEEVERLTRVLAVECGDASQARPGWRRENSLEWSGPGERWVYRTGPGRWIWACGPTVRGETRTAIEAMEAADRAAGGAA